jgi:NADPH:quinone reductase-like Zn-dependent oxidoreductase
MGRPATGRTTKVVRVPADMDWEKAVTVYYEWLPIIERYKDQLTTSPRDYKLAKLLEELKP